MISRRERAADSLKAGDSFIASRTFTQKDVITFAQVSLDYTPVLFDDRFAVT